MLRSYVDTLARGTLATVFTRLGGEAMEDAAAMAEVTEAMRATHASGGRVWFVGNGGSAAVASHLANDFTKNGGIRAAAVSDAAVLTCLANDFGYAQVYAKAIEFQAGPRDGLVAISSSGNSENILNAVASARARGCWVLTLSGFRPGNKLRELGDFNFYLGAMSYGMVEIGHLILLHAILDRAMGWTPPLAAAVTEPV